ncbi:MAG: DUF4437 domain-containing protein [Pseudomonadales bacterium]|nr:DUF4437 domain-containing protein [Pseudomonadales bacterium]
MNKTSTPFMSVLVLSATLLTPTLALATDAINSLPASELVWENTPEGVAFAPLRGNRFKESYMTMVRLPAGLVSPAHTKTANMFGVMISGAMVHTVVGAGLTEEIVLAKGSFYTIPKNVPHVSKCVSTVDCVTFLYQDGKFDFVPVSK